jgi:hypothetical protein
MPSCTCNACVNPPGTLFRRMPLCPTCGNKRCPRGTEHLQPCSGSNEPGQRGSLYTPACRFEEKP